MGTRGRRRAVLTVLAALVLAGCGSASDPSPPAGVDGLVIPTPSVDPDDFVTGVDNPWLPLPVGATWEYAVTGARQGSTTVTTLEGPDVEGVATTAVRAETTPEKGARHVVTDFYAQDDAGNVWWFGREGEWLTGRGRRPGGAGDGGRPAGGRRLPPGGGRGGRPARGGARSRRQRTVPAGTYDDLVTVAVTSPLTGVVEHAYYAEGVGLVLLDTVEGEPEMQLGLVAYDEP